MLYAKIHLMFKALILQDPRRLVEVLEGLQGLQQQALVPRTCHHLHQMSKCIHGHPNCHHSHTRSLDVPKFDYTCVHRSIRQRRTEKTG